MILEPKPAEGALRFISTITGGLYDGLAWEWYPIEPAPKPAGKRGARPCDVRYTLYRQKMADAGFILPSPANGHVDAIIFFMRMPHLWSGRQKTQYDGERFRREMPSVKRLLEGVSEIVGIDCRFEDVRIYRRWAAIPGIAIVWPEMAAMSDPSPRVHI